MATQDLVAITKEEVALDFQNITSDTTTNGNNVDMTGFQSVMFLVVAGTLTDGTYTPVIQEADDDGTGSPDTFAAVADADLLPTGTGQEAAAAVDASNEISQIGYRGTKKWVRCNIASTSTTTGGRVGVVSVKGHPADSSNT